MCAYNMIVRLRNYALSRQEHSEVVDTTMYAYIEKVIETEQHNLEHDLIVKKGRRDGFKFLSPCSLNKWKTTIKFNQQIEIFAFYHTWIWWLLISKTYLRFIQSSKCFQQISQITANAIQILKKNIMMKNLLDLSAVFTYRIILKCCNISLNCLFHFSGCYKCCSQIYVPN